MKKFLPLCLMVVLCLCCLSACSGTHEENTWFSEEKLSGCLVGDLPTIGKEYVKTVLDERERILNRNRYKMNIEIMCNKGEPDVVGKVILYRKKKAIHQATLKVRDKNSNKGIIFWSFDKE